VVAPAVVLRDYRRGRESVGELRRIRPHAEPVSLPWVSIRRDSLKQIRSSYSSQYSYFAYFPAVLSSKCEFVVYTESDEFPR